MAYDSPGTLGPTADYAGDSSDYSGGSSFNWNGFADSIVSIIPGVLTGSAALYNATHNQQGQVVPYGSPYAINPYQQQQPVPANNTLMYVGISVLALIVVIALVYFLTRKK